MNSYDLMVEKYRKELMNASKKSSYTDEQIEPVQPVIETEAPPAVNVDEPQTEPVIESETPPTVNDNEPQMDDTDPPVRYTGTLRVEVYAADRAYAIPNARVTVAKSEDLEKLPVFNGLTDISGIISGIVLEAPSDSITAQPGILTGYASYDINVEHPRFKTQRFISVPIFAGVESVQPVQMVPKNGDDSDIIIREREPSRLRSEAGEN